MDDDSYVLNTIQTWMRTKDSVLIVGLNKTIDQLAVASSVHWYGDVLRREDGHVLRMALDY